VCQSVSTCFSVKQVSAPCSSSEREEGGERSEKKEEGREGAGGKGIIMEFESKCEEEGRK